MIDITGKDIKIVDEKRYRARLIEEARYLGCERELLQIFAKYDNLLRNCTDPKERENIGCLGVLEVSTLIDGRNVGAGGCLTVNGNVILSCPENNDE